MASRFNRKDKNCKYIYKDNILLRLNPGNFVVVRIQYMQLRIDIILRPVSTIREI